MWVSHHGKVGYSRLRTITMTLPVEQDGGLRIAILGNCPAGAVRLDRDDQA